MSWVKAIIRSCGKLVDGVVDVTDVVTGPSKSTSLSDGAGAGVGAGGGSDISNRSGAGAACASSKKSHWKVAQTGFIKTTLQLRMCWKLKEVLVTPSQVWQSASPVIELEVFPRQLPTFQSDTFSAASSSSAFAPSSWSAIEMYITKRKSDLPSTWIFWHFFHSITLHFYSPWHSRARSPPSSWFFHSLTWWPQSKHPQMDGHLRSSTIFG